ncbi:MULTISPECIES: DUF1273 domain-containing protein [Exiguobacterium]|uniref:DUF1273 domain-containing protein n=1 Tax=Exiguobacterium antarcticum TaxID=132920 RepID=A0ABT6R4R1_9BACL|nr:MULTISPECIES: DUF1273 domain-containing protein [Exiguobacterium]AFS70723.1 UPF0398 protein ypsA [Exiguobacterium antarcticum B7]MCT4781039.1 DUF1273 domain-containing protein [Exiguobacterium soli]MDI3235944.1 DUF1273 domain-containing protein [Exiguobacterium antarcticum]OIN68002.1 hypothetical protein BLD48_03910 [Exiguobacterium sp. KRL4]
MKVVAVTGYKPTELGIFDQKHPGIKILKAAYRERLIRLIEDMGTTWFITSAAPGCELWACEVILELKQEYPDIRLGILLPFLEQEAKWKEPVQAQYLAVLNQADFVDAISQKPYENPSQFRNKTEFMIQKSQGLLSVFDEEHGGSAKYLVERAKLEMERSDYQLFLITQDDLAMMEQEQTYNEQWE